MALEWDFEPKVIVEIDGICCRFLGENSAVKMHLTTRELVDRFDHTVRRPADLNATELDALLALANSHQHHSAACNAGSDSASSRSNRDGIAIRSSAAAQ